MAAAIDSVADLNAVCPAEAVLRDNALGVPLGGKQKRSNCRRNRGSNFRNTMFADYSGTAGHV